MSSWQELDLVNLSDEAQAIPDGEYLFSLLSGAKYGTFDKAKIDFGVKIQEGEFKGRVIYPSFPDPDKQTWSAQAFKKFERALVKNGAREITEHEDPIVYLNDPEVTGHQFTAPVNTRTYTKQDGEEATRTDIKLFKVKAVANA